MLMHSFTVLEKAHHCAKWRLGSTRKRAFKATLHLARLTFVDITHMHAKSIFSGVALFTQRTLECVIWCMGNLNNKVIFILTIYTGMILSGVCVPFYTPLMISFSVESMFRQHGCRVATETRDNLSETRNPRAHVTFGQARLWYARA